ncbi:MAG: ABC transporter substrate-binding protein [Boseongicola sp.]|nr:ABC transporter substrate-binding protein [Boseongicola sp.]
MNNLTRRATLAGLIATMGLTANPTFALSTDEARNLINEVVGKINSVINSGKSESAMYRDFEDIFNRYADVPTISRSALGPPARSASSQQLKQFSDAFAGYLARKYGKQFRDFIGGKITVESARQIKSFQEVQAVAKLRGQSPFNVTFMVSDRSGSERFFDLLIEGISLLKSERAEIGAMLDKRGGNIDSLIRDLKSAG